MKVSDLRKLVSQRPGNMSPEEFDNLQVMISRDGDFESPHPESSGVSTFGGPCDKGDIKITDDTSEHTFFILVGHQVFAG